MLRKIGAIAALMLTLPALANAWTITAKIGSGAGAITSDSSTVTATKTALGAPVIGYFKTVDNNVLQQQITVAPETGNFLISSVILDGVNVTAQGAAGVFTVLEGTPVKNHSLAVYFTPVTSSLTVTQATGGTVSVQHLDAGNKPFGSISRIGFAGLKVGNQVRVFGAPNRDYSVVSVAGTAKNGLQGDAYYQDVTIAAGTNSVTAVFNLEPVVFPRVTVDTTSPVVGSAAKLDMSATYSNGATPGYSFISTPTGAVFAPYSTSKARVTLGTISVGTPFTVTVTAAITGASANATTPRIIFSTGNDRNASCTLCHNNRDSVLVATYYASGHAANSHGPACATCHSSAPHNNPAPIYSAGNVGGQCISCHNGNYSRLFGAVTHFANATSATFKNISAGYVGYKGKGINICAKCHFQFDAHTIGGSTTGQFLINTDILGAWADSGHGDRSGLAWLPTGHDWRNSGSTVNFQKSIPASDCVRCHTADGYAKFVSSAFTNVSSIGAADGQKFNSPLACTACHATDAPSGSTVALRRAVPAVTTFYNVSTANNKVAKKTIKSRIAANFPDVGESNICIACHTARVSGPNLTGLFNTGNWDLSNASFQNSHYMGAAGTMYMTVGFKNFTTLTAPAPKSNEGASFASSQTYDQTLSALDTTSPSGIAGGQNSAHRRLGTPLIAGSEDYLVAANDPTAIASNGPCVTCHLKAYNPVAGNTFTPPAAGRPGAGHSLQIDDATAQQLCLQCHADAPHLDGGTGTGAGIYTTITNLALLQSTMLTPQSDAFQNGLNLAKQLLLVKYMISYDQAKYPYFYDETLPLKNGSKQAVTDWTRKLVAGSSDAAVTALGTTNVTVIPTGGLTQVQAYRLMGACFNLNVLARDPGAYVHARTYTQRLVYDTVDFLDNNVMDFTPLATARALNPGVYSGMEANVLIAAPVGGLATESMAWLAGTHYTDSKGQTSVPLRLRP